MFSYFQINVVPKHSPAVPISQDYVSVCAECSATDMACFFYECSDTKHDFEDDTNSKVCALCPRCVLPKALVNYSNNLSCLVFHLERRFGASTSMHTEPMLLALFGRANFAEMKTLIDQLPFISAPQEYQVISMRTFWRFKNIIVLCCEANPHCKFSHMHEIIHHLIAKFRPFMVRFRSKSLFSYSHEKDYEKVGLETHESHNILHKCLYAADSLQIDLLDAMLVVYLNKENLIKVSTDDYDTKVVALNTFIEGPKSPMLLADRSAQCKKSRKRVH